MAGADTAAGAARAAGLLGSIKALVATLIDIAHTRLQLLGNEIHEERLRVRQLLLLGVIAGFFFVLAVLLFTLFVIVFFWDSNRLLAIGGFAGFYLAIAAGFVIALRSRAATGSRLFKASLGELRKDRSVLS
jgi:uncharacterized membrane protein YqjE